MLGYLSCCVQTSVIPACLWCNKEYNCKERTHGLLLSEPCPLDVTEEVNGKIIDIRCID